ncbi:DUF4136 domain-containing protein [Vibrio sp. 10N.222.51.C8]|uniref:DUF4136 domain-containing protein n=1 Tax=unclassified Vibrio TaxID=2614977 RepID=UPI000C8227BE|nr:MULTISPECIES: DUF4136 domain-containing protein [unclassified Vibrio]PMK21837.1 hypothetical protein BCU05_12010 [Vibrio sp. 10N.261.54.C3]PMN96426.1 hypothetical protein BCT21_03330 [Vibrio sp. 10N.222.55.F9]PMO02358.1 hypothetical protein BCT20_10555 [Vibrio sp. 10N.222.55.C12]PMO16856.1 hypothetical protein BCT17_06495 [Vibrio sp. 10N.222.54.F10]PMO17163.1 hypothetical protein BCT16_15390 [Vibrio sp. 10N.222.54.B6]
MLRLTTILLTLPLAACSTINTDFDKQTDFSMYKTYDFSSPGTAAEEKNKIPISIDSIRIESAIIKEMSRTGVSFVEDGGDLYVRYQLQQASELVSSGSSFGIGYGWNNFRGGMSTPQNYHQQTYGQLVVELIDDKTNIVVWTANSSRKLTRSMSSKEREELIYEEIAEMFQQYPSYK